MLMTSLLLGLNLVLASTPNCDTNDDGRLDTYCEECVDIDEDGAYECDPGANCDTDADGIDDTTCEPCGDSDADGIKECGGNTCDTDGDGINDTVCEHCLDIDADGRSECVTDDDGDGFYAEDDDCDDTDASTFPGAAENESSTWCMNDDDGDGYGDDTVSGSVIAGEDCDDGNDEINPDAEEIADRVDNDCDSEIDEGFSEEDDTDGEDDEDEAEGTADEDGEDTGSSERSTTWGCSGTGIHYSWLFLPAVFFLRRRRQA